MSHQQSVQPIIASPAAWARAALSLSLLATLADPAAATGDDMAPAAAAPASQPAKKPLAYVDVASSRGGFDCSPGPIGAGTLPTTRSNAAGTVAWWYCPAPGGAWRVNWAAATAAQLSARNLLAETRAVISAADPKAAFSAAVSKNVKVPLSDPSLTAVWQPFTAEMLAGAPKTPSKGSPRAETPK